jgi:hypothetical protein
MHIFIAFNAKQAITGLAAAYALTAWKIFFECIGCVWAGSLKWRCLSLKITY